MFNKVIYLTLACVLVAGSLSGCRDDVPMEVIVDPSVAETSDSRLMQFLSDKATPKGLGYIYHIVVPYINQQKNLLNEKVNFYAKCYRTLIHNQIAQRLGDAELALEKEDKEKGLAFAKVHAKTISRAVEEELLNLETGKFSDHLKPDYWNALSGNEKETLYLKYLYYLYQDFLIKKPRK